MTEIHGTFDPRFDTVRTTFAAHFAGDLRGVLLVLAAYESLADAS